jgi:hypothetical protein
VRFIESHVFEGDPLVVWERVSDLASIPLYWHGTREFRVGEHDGRKIAEVVFAFGGRGSALVTVDEKSRTLTIEYVRGPFGGSQTVTVKDDEVVAAWDVRFNGIYRVLGPFNESHFRGGTRNALKRICAGTPR